MEDFLLRHFLLVRARLKEVLASKLITFGFSFCFFRSNQSGLSLKFISLFATAEEERSGPRTGRVRKPDQSRPLGPNVMPAGPTESGRNGSAAALAFGRLQCVIVWHFCSQLFDTGCAADARDAHVGWSVFNLSILACATWCRTNLAALPGVALTQ